MPRLATNETLEKGFALIEKAIKEQKQTGGSETSESTNYQQLVADVAMLKEQLGNGNTGLSNDAKKKIVDTMYQNSYSQESKTKIEALAAEFGVSISKENDTLQNVIEDLQYIPINIISFTASQNVAELGSKITSILFSWDFAGEAKTLVLDGKSLEANLKTYTLSNLNLTQSKQFLLTATDKKNKTSSKTATINFLNGVYFGVKSVPESVDSLFLKSLSKTLQSSKTKTFSVNCGTNEYVWYAVPARYGTPTFNVGGFDGGFSKIKTIQFENSSGYTESYDVYRSDNGNLGTQTIKAL